MNRINKGPQKVSEFRDGIKIKSTIFEKCTVFPNMENFFPI